VLGVVLGARLLLEVLLLVVLGWWGWRIADGSVGVVLAVALPLAAAVVWGLVVAPRARLRLPSWLRIVVEIGLFAAGAAALAWLTRPSAGIGLLAADLVVIALLAWTARGSGEGLSPHDVQRASGVGGAS
jgi:hypothetical protein